MKITIEFDTDNAAFEDHFGPEVNNVLDQAGRIVKNYAAGDVDGARLRDSYGNSVGEVRFSA